MAHINMSKAIIKGAIYFKDSIDGKVYDTGTLLIEEPLELNNDGARGSAGCRTVEYKCSDSAIVKQLIDKYEHMFPVTADLTIEMMATKRGKDLVVRMINPISLDKKVA